jgi:predicted acetyltransferase
MNEDPTIHFYGLFEDGVLRGGMRFHDFIMNLHGARALVGGVGGVAVALHHKKEKIARDMLQYFLRHYKARGAALTALYPFRPDFYHRMGFGYGAKLNQYRVTPDSLPRSGGKEHIFFLEESDKEEMQQCYQRVMTAQHGLMTVPAYTWDYLFQNPALRVLGYRKGGQIRGYLVFTFSPTDDDNFLRHDLAARTLVYENQSALRALLTFLHTQLDQVERVVINTPEPAFHLLLRDPRNDSGRLLPSVWHESNTQGVGIMYRVINVKRLFDVLGERDFGGQSCRLRLLLTDSFFPENAGAYGLVFDNGRCSLQSEINPDATLEIDVAEFSSLVTGAASFSDLRRYGLAALSPDRYRHQVNALFRADDPPWCLTSF